MLRCAPGQLVAAVRHLQPCTHVIQRLVHNAEESSNEEEMEIRTVPRPDVLHRSATEIVWPASSRQEKFAAKVHRVLGNVLMHDAVLRQSLVERYGFAVEEVRTSPDNLKAFLLWDSYSGHEREAATELARRKGRLRSAVAGGLGVRNAPLLVFRKSGMSSEEARLESVLEGLAIEDLPSQRGF
ncbi:hypothetical protein ACKKBG_A39285 [Auxenochlorella protothecoides x Auxenochlorella symbiontica]